MRPSPSKALGGVDRSLEEPFGTPAFDSSGGGSRFPDIAGGGDSQAAQVDGKAFFKRARHRLSFQQFNEFLANIKKLNAHSQSREETLEKARFTLTLTLTPTTHPNPDSMNARDGHSVLTSRHQTGPGHLRQRERRHA